LYDNLRNLVFAVGISLMSSMADAQPVQITEPTGPVSLSTTEEIGFSNGSFLVAPIPFENPALGSGLAVGTAYMFSADPASDTSSLGIGAFKTSNNSQGYGAGLSYNFGSNRWSVSVLAADVDLNYDLYVNSEAVPISQSAQAVRLEFGFGATEDMTIGAGVSYAQSEIRGRDRPLRPEFLDDAKVELLKGRLILEKDSRDNEFYPESGSLISGELSYGQLTNIHDRTYLKAHMSASIYSALFDNGVVAGNFTACGASPMRRSSTLALLGWMIVFAAIHLQSLSTKHSCPCS
jgi:hypothetical protein